ncbi:MAG: hypothetical protein EOP45_20430 [Sphingobacteriaceae bacterium]|nr:MAG: hypothetical protein EOP45_20430 [Sphingobacteriaceae bacterium]
MYIKAPKNDMPTAMRTKFTVVFTAEETKDIGHDTLPNISTSAALIEHESEKQDNPVIIPTQTKDAESNELSVQKSVEKYKLISTPSQPEAQQSDGHSSKVGASNREDLNTKLKKKPKIEKKTN